MVQDTLINIEHCGMYLVGKFLSYSQPIMNNIYGNYFEIDEVYPNIFIGNFSSACQPDKLQNLGVTHIVTVLSGVGEMYPDKFKYLTIDICDRNYSDIKQYFENSNCFIDNAINNGGKVFVHCKSGISRSATIVLAYLIKVKKMPLNLALNSIKSKRKIINPNDGFIAQLKLYEKEK